MPRHHLMLWALDACPGQKRAMAVFQQADSVEVRLDVPATALVSFAALADHVGRALPSFALAGDVQVVERQLESVRRDLGVAHFADAPPPVNVDLVAEQLRRMGLPYITGAPAVALPPPGAPLSAGRRAELLSKTESGRRILAAEQGG